jgi:hypothetical protein
VIPFVGNRSAHVGVHADLSMDLAILWSSTTSAVRARLEHRLLNKTTIAMHGAVPRPCRLVDRVPMTEGLWPASADGPRHVQWGRAALAVIVTALLLVLVAANIAVRFSWVEVEDGILWEARAEGVVAARVGA